MYYHYLFIFCGSIILSLLKNDIFKTFENNFSEIISFIRVTLSKRVKCLKVFFKYSI